MITSALIFILWAILAVITSPLLLLDNVQPITAIDNAIASMSSLLTALSIVVSVVTIVQIIVADIIFETSVFFYKGVKWIYQKLPFIN